MLEIEAKFRVHPPYRIPDLVGDRTGVATVDPATAQELRAVYWDTADLRLAREGITLRHRQGEGAKDGWHLKLPVHRGTVPDASTGTREELHAAGAENDIPAELSDLVAVHVRGAMVGPVATLLTTRSVQVLRDADGAPLAELTDDLVSVVNQGHVAGRFREIEVEDLGGGRAVLTAVGEVLRGAGAVGGEFVPKVVRALGPQATADPDPPAPLAVSPDDPASCAVRETLRGYVRQLMAADPAVRRGHDDAVHQMRVAARRLRSALKTFAPLVDLVWATSLREDLKWLADSLGGARDGEVLLARLLGQLDEIPAELQLGPVRARIEQTVGGDLVAARAAAVETLRTERYLALVDRLVDSAWEPLLTEAADAPSGEAVPPLVRAAWDRLSKRAGRLRRRDATDDDWHATRIAAKQVRYACEAVTPIFGRRAKTLAKKAEAVQELIGEHQDAVVAQEVLRRLAAAPRNGGTAFTVGLLHARQQLDIEDARRTWAGVWADASAPKHRRWLRA